MRKHSFTSILITGATSGIGRAVALALAGPGTNITVTGRDKERLDAIEKALADKGANVAAHLIDVTDREKMTEMMADAERRAPLDLVIANAGISSGGTSSEDMDGEVTRDIFAVNLAGVLNTVLPAATLMTSRRQGQIAVVSSVAGYRGLLSAPAYSASKVAVKAWGEAIRPDLADKGVHLSIIIPGFVKSRITDQNNFKMPFLMSAEKAADIIVRGLAGRKRTIAFPWQMVLIMRALTMLPGPIFDAIIKRGPKKS